MKANYIGKTFAVIDRVVLAYLANHYTETDINRRLMAVIMPYSAFQPYVADSARVMPPEIFMGRKTELEKIESAAGVNIVSHTVHCAATVSGFQTRFAHIW